MKNIKYNNITFIKINGFDNYYISRCGKVLNINYNETKKSNLLKLGNCKGYLIVGLWKNNKGNTKIVSRLVAQAFIKNINNKPEVNHINGIKTDNRVENLEWCTAKENSVHKFKVLKIKGSMFGKFGKNHNCSKKVEQLDLQGNLIKVWYSARDISRELKIDYSSISKVCRGIRNTAGGFKFRGTK